MRDRNGHSRRLEMIGVGEEDMRLSFLDHSDEIFEPPRVFIMFDAMRKIQYFIHLARGEINGLGFVERRGNDLVITDALILEQRVNSAHAEIDAMALNRFVAECDDYDKLRFQWHSHVNMHASFSPEDLGTIAGYASDFMISLVINKRGQYSCRLDMYKPFYAGFRVPLSVILPEDEELMQSCREDIERCVEETGFSLGGMVPQPVRRALRISDPTVVEDWDQEKDPASVPVLDLAPEESES